MIWVCRTGKNSEFIGYYKENQRIYLPWDGYNINLSNYKDIQEYRELVKKEKKTDVRVSISNWAGQLYTFVYGMQKDDYVLLPYKQSVCFS